MPERRRAEVAGDRLCFEVGRHLLRTEKCADGWAASVDGLFIGARHSSQAEAWRVGVQAALALDAPGSALAPASALHRGQAPSSPPEGTAGPGAAEASDD